VNELVREARRDGSRVAILRCRDDELGGSVVELEAEQTGVRRRYRFGTAPEAFRFIQEALLALQYLGCTVS
jgi:hypothetical protein